MSRARKSTAKQPTTIAAPTPAAPTPAAPTPAAPVLMPSTAVPTASSTATAITNRPRPTPKPALANSAATLSTRAPLRDIINNPSIGAASATVAVANVAVTPAPAAPAATPSHIASALAESGQIGTREESQAALFAEIQRLRAEIHAQHEALVLVSATANGGPPHLPVPSQITPGDDDVQIPRPRPLPPNLQVAMGLQNDNELYLACRRVVRTCVSRVDEAHQTLWHDQPDEFIAKVKSLAKARCPQLGRYRNGWATEVIMCSSNKNKRRYERMLAHDLDGTMRKARAAARAAKRARLEDAEDTHADTSGNDADDEGNMEEQDAAGDQGANLNSLDGLIRLDDDISVLTEEDREENLQAQELPADVPEEEQVVDEEIRPAKKQAKRNGTRSNKRGKATGRG